MEAGRKHFECFPNLNYGNTYLDSSHTVYRVFVTFQQHIS